METNRLRQFCVVCETRNLRKAAEILNMSHSALSKSLKVLQDELKMTLFVQEGRGLSVTDDGSRFYGKVKTFLNHEQELLSKNSSAKSIIRIGTFEVFSTHFLGSVWGKYFGQNGLELHELLPGKLEASVAESRIDAGLTYEPIPRAGLDFLKLGKVKMGIFKKRNAFKSDSLNQLPFVAPLTPVEGTPTGIRGLDGWPEDKINRNVVYRVDMMESGLSLARSGLAVIFIPRFVARFHNMTADDGNKLEEHPLPEKMAPVYRRVYLIKRKATPEDALIRGLAKIVRNECVED